MKQVTTGRILVDIVSIGDLVAVVLELRSPGSMRREVDLNRDHHDVHVRAIYLSSYIWRIPLPSTEHSTAKK